MTLMKTERRTLNDNREKNVLLLAPLHAYDVIPVRSQMGRQIRSGFDGDFFGSYVLG